MRLLLVEDDHRTADYIVRGLTEAGHVCDLLRNGHDGLFAATSGGYDVIVADRMIPGLDGLSMVKAVRAAGGRPPPRLLPKGVAASTPPRARAAPRGPHKVSTTALSGR
ncbi:response regulator, partial [Mesorhizobium australicum]|uniref:response regulator n=1 Tax=Mesorhizobium australicum TaxID=536018 RepID=UPI00333DD83B